MALSAEVSAAGIEAQLPVLSEMNSFVRQLS